MMEDTDMRRFGQVIGVKPEFADEYERLQAAMWPEIRAAMTASQVRNYTIFRHGETLFGYFEYLGDDFAADMARLNDEPKMREWWTLTGPMQQPLADRAPGEWWLTMREIFHQE
ncbi:MAG TPA: L-rhamnose mutarotase [Ktedonobacterales bacterium]|nr:L-rhamnose mutarotase [Ktedonobacterales bacterium]